MPPKRKQVRTTLAEDSIRANPKAGQLLQSLLTNGTMNRSTEPSDMYGDPKYRGILAPVTREKWRKKMKYEQQMLFDTGMFFLCFLCLPNIEFAEPIRGVTENFEINKSAYEANQ